MIKNLEPVYKELEELFIKQLPDYIEKINKEFNDGIILKPFENIKLNENCIKLPCFKFDIEEVEYSEKDRIIENTVFVVSFEIKLSQFNENQIIIMWRYVEAIKEMLNEQDSDYKYQIMSLKTNRIYIKIKNQ